MREAGAMKALIVNNGHSGRGRRVRWMAALAVSGLAHVLVFKAIPNPQPDYRPTPARTVDLLLLRRPPADPASPSNTNDAPARRGQPRTAIARATASDAPQLSSLSPGISEPEVDGQGRELSSRWRVAPSRFFDAARLTDRLDCSIANARTTWKARDQHCDEPPSEDHL